MAQVGYAWNYAQDPAVQNENFAKGEADARQAVALAPELPESHVALAGFYASGGTLDLRRANEEYERAVALGPGNAQVLRRYALFAVWMGHSERASPEAAEASRQAKNVAPDQLEVDSEHRARSG